MFGYALSSWVMAAGIALILRVIYVSVGRDPYVCTEHADSVSDKAAMICGVGLVSVSCLLMAVGW